jgi:hypothetical protein
MAWLERHSPGPPIKPKGRLFHFTPHFLLVAPRGEGLFAKLTKRRLRRGSFASLGDLQAAINPYLHEVNADPKSFIWTPEPNGIIEKVRHRC